MGTAMRTVTARFSLPNDVSGLPERERLKGLRAALESVAAEFGGKLRECDPRPMTWEGEDDEAHQAELVLGLTNNEMRKTAGLPEDLIDHR